MQDTDKSSFVWESDNTMNKPITIKLKEETRLSLDAVESKTYKKGRQLTATSTQQKRLFLHLIESEKAEEVNVVDTKTKKSTPKETKSAPTSSNTVDEIKAYLDSEDIEYDSTAKKSQLLDLID